MLTENNTTLHTFLADLIERSTEGLECKSRLGTLHATITLRFFASNRLYLKTQMMFVPPTVPKSHAPLAIHLYVGCL